MKIKNMKDEKESPTPIHRDQMALPFPNGVMVERCLEKIEKILMVAGTGGE